MFAEDQFACHCESRCNRGEAISSYDALSTSHSSLNSRRSTLDSRLPTLDSFSLDSRLAPPPKRLWRAGGSTLGSSSRGYTLMEMLVVIAIIMLVASITVPSFSTMLQTGRFDSGVR